MRTIAALLASLFLDGCAYLTWGTVSRPEATEGVRVEDRQVIVVPGLRLGVEVNNSAVSGPVLALAWEFDAGDAEVEFDPAGIALGGDEGQAVFPASGWTVPARPTREPMLGGERRCERPHGALPSPVGPLASPVPRAS